MALSIWDLIHRFVVNLKKRGPGIRGVVIAYTYSDGTRGYNQTIIYGDLLNQRSAIMRHMSEHENTEIERDIERTGVM